jgi:hypothetical protein
LEFRGCEARIVYDVIESPQLLIRDSWSLQTPSPDISQYMAAGPLPPNDGVSVFDVSPDT